MEWEDYYRILQVHYLAEQEVIEASYKRLCKKYHPDLNLGLNNEEKMKMLNCAYDVLGNKEKRKKYHMEWMKRHTSEKKSSDNYQQDISIRAASQTEKAAMSVVERYFNYLLNGKYELAYGSLTIIDRYKIAKDDFVKWQKAVSSVFVLGSYSISFYKEYKDFAIGDKTYEKIREYGISISEKNIATGYISKDCIIKYVVYENGEWFVYLGYDCLKPLIRKFDLYIKAISHIDYSSAFNIMLTKINPSTGIYNREGFLEKAEIEVERSNRYGNVFSIAIVDIVYTFMENQVSIEENADHLIINAAANIIKNNLRKTDLLGHWESSSFIILFCETNKLIASNAIKKLYTKFQEEIQFDIFIHAGIAQYTEGELDECIRQAEANRRK